MPMPKGPKGRKRTAEGQAHVANLPAGNVQGGGDRYEGNRCGNQEEETEPLTANACLKGRTQCRLVARRVRVG